MALLGQRSILQTRDMRTFEHSTIGGKVGIFLSWFTLDPLAGWLHLPSTRSETLSPSLSRDFVQTKYRGPGSLLTERDRLASQLCKTRCLAGLTLSDLVNPPFLLGSAASTSDRSWSIPSTFWSPPDPLAPSIWGGECPEPLLIPFFESTAS